MAQPFLDILYLASNANSFYYGASHIFGSATQLGADMEKIEDAFGQRDTYVLMIPKDSTATEAELSEALHKIPQVKAILSYVDTVGETISEQYLDDKTHSKLNSDHYSIPGKSQDDWPPSCVPGSQGFHKQPQTGESGHSFHWCRSDRPYGNQRNAFHCRSSTEMNCLKVISTRLSYCTSISTFLSAQPSPKISSKILEKLESGLFTKLARSSSTSTLLTNDFSTTYAYVIVVGSCETSHHYWPMPVYAWRGLTVASHYFSLYFTHC